jgi:hypothetical protein
MFAHDDILSARGMSVNHASAARPYRFHIYDAEVRRIFYASSATSRRHESFLLRKRSYYLSLVIKS